MPSNASIQLDNLTDSLAQSGLLTTRMQEYISKTRAIYNTKSVDKLKIISALNESYPNEVSIILNNMYNKNK